MSELPFECTKEDCQRKFSTKVGRNIHYTRAHVGQTCKICGPLDGNLGPHLEKFHPDVVAYLPENKELRELLLERDQTIRELRWRIVELDPQPREVEYVGAD